MVVRFAFRLDVRHVQIVHSGVFNRRTATDDIRHTFDDYALREEKNHGNGRKKFKRTETSFPGDRVGGQQRR